MKGLASAVPRAGEFRLHPLSFFYLQDDVGGGVTQRVHVWLPDSRDGPENDRHQHSFDIESLVVAGKMRSELFQFRKTVDGPELEFAVSYKGGNSVLRPTGKRGVLDAIATFETAAGGRYRLEAGVIHRVAVDARPCVTVLTTTERGIPIYSYGLAKEEQPFVRRTAGPDEARRIATVIENAMRS